MKATEIQVEQREDLPVVNDVLECLDEMVEAVDVAAEHDAPVEREPCGDHG